MKPFVHQEHYCMKLKRQGHCDTVHGQTRRISIGTKTTNLTQLETPHQYQIPAATPINFLCNAKKKKNLKTIA